MPTPNAILRTTTVLAALFVLGACAAAATAPTMVPQVMGIEGATMIGTGKSITDHIFSFSTGKNCSTLRKNTGRHYCEEDEVTVPEEVFCYNTLGDVTCYGQPAPHGEQTKPIGQVPVGAPQPR